MSVSRRFVLDANIFIEAHQRYYGFDICPAFWIALVWQHDAKRVYSIDKVKQELVKVRAKDEGEDKEDKLSKWAQEQAPDTFFKETADKKVSDAFRDMVKWVQNDGQFKQEAKAQFAKAADGWLVAYAKTNNLVVVTHEEYAPDIKKKVPIPNVCIEFDVACCNTFQMLRHLKEQFVLKRRQRRN